MVGNRSRDTRPEIAIRSLLHRQGHRFWVAKRPTKSVRRTADVVFPRLRLAVFVDGCFWHRCPTHFVLPKTNTSYWQTKIDGNAARDIDTTAALEAEGWRVLRSWEHDDPAIVVKEIAAEIRGLREAQERDRSPRGSRETRRAF